MSEPEQSKVTFNRWRIEAELGGKTFIDSVNKLVVYSGDSGDAEMVAIVCPHWHLANERAELIASAPTMYAELQRLQSLNAKLLAACEAAEDLLLRCDHERRPTGMKAATEEEWDQVVNQLRAAVAETKAVTTPH